MSRFKPMLAPNEQIDLDAIKYGLLASTKLDGCRLLVYIGQLVTRSLKPLQNKQLREKFKPLCKSNVTLMDGEVYAEGIPFYMISSCFTTQDYNTKKSIQRWQVLCETYEMDITREEVLKKLKFYIFDCVHDEHFNEAFVHRVSFAEDLAKDFPDLIVPVQQVLVNSANEVRTMFKKVLKRGYEGLMLKDPNGKYKFGRGTVKEALIFKVKPYVTIDAQIIGVEQATKVDPNAPKTINELGRSVTSKKQEDRILIPRAKTFTVIYKVNGEYQVKRHEVDVGIGGTEAERDEIWANQKSYMGRWIEYKGLLVGSKDVPRHCNMERWRTDRD